MLNEIKICGGVSILIPNYNISPSRKKNTAADSLNSVYIPKTKIITRIRSFGTEGAWVLHLLNVFSFSFVKEKHPMNEIQKKIKKKFYSRL